MVSEWCRVASGVVSGGVRVVSGRRPVASGRRPGGVRVVLRRCRVCGESPEPAYLKTYRAVAVERFAEHQSALVAPAPSATQSGDETAPSRAIAGDRLIAPK